KPPRAVAGAGRSASSSRPACARHSGTRSRPRWSARAKYVRHPARFPTLMTEFALRAFAGFRKGRGSALVPPWIAPAFLLGAVVLVPWTAMLFVTLPMHYGANHWRAAWAGVDILLGFALASTAIAIL